MGRKSREKKIKREMQGYQRQGQLYTPKQQRVMSRRDFFKYGGAAVGGAVILGGGGYLVNKFVSDRAKRYIHFDYEKGPFYNPELTGALRTEEGYKAFLNAAFYDGRKGTTRLLPDYYNVRVFKPSKFVEEEMSKNGFTYEDYLKVIVDTMNAYAINTNRQIRYNPLILEPEELIPAENFDESEQIDPFNFNFAILGRGQGPFTDRILRGEGGVYIITPGGFRGISRDGNIVNGAIILFNASVLYTHNGIKAVASQEIGEVFFNCDDLQIPSPTGNPNTMLLYEAEDPNTYTGEFPRKTDLEIGRAIYNYRPGTSLEHILQTTNGLRPQETAPGEIEMVFN